MSSVGTHLNFPGNTEEAFNFYKSVFGGEFKSNFMRFGDMPPAEGMPPIPEDAKKLIAHIELPILGGFLLMGADAPAYMGMTINFGNAIQIALEIDTRAETKRIYDALSAGGNVTMALDDMFWGGYYGTFFDKYGVQWMVNCMEKKAS